MSTKAPILGSESLTETFKNAKNDSSFGWMQIGIDMEKNQFVVLKNEKCSESIEETWKNIKALFTEKNHTYIITKDPRKGELFLLIHYGPDLSPVKQRMIYASSRATLKSMLGSAEFTSDYFISNASDCSVNELTKQREMHLDIDFRSDKEIEKEEALYETTPKSISSSVMQKLPIEMKESAINAINKYVSNELKCVFLLLNASDQSIEGTEESKCNTIDDIKLLLPESEPRYILFQYTNSQNSSESKSVFGYYCPEKAQRQLKFTYSTCKSNIIDYCRESVNYSFGGKIEFSSIADFKNDYLDYHLFPKTEVKETFSKPKPGGRRGKRRGSRGVNKKLFSLGEE